MGPRHRLSLEIDEAFSVHSDHLRLRALHRLVSLLLTPPAIEPAQDGAAFNDDDHAEARALLHLRMMAGELGELELADFARQGKFEASVATLACLSGLPATACEAALWRENPDLFIVVCRSLNLAWSTVSALLDLRPCGPLADDIRDDICDDYHQIAVADAQRIRRFLGIYFRLGSTPAFTAEDDPLSSA